METRLKIVWDGDASGHPSIGSASRSLGLPLTHLLGLSGGLHQESSRKRRMGATPVCRGGRLAKLASQLDLQSLDSRRRPRLVW